MQITIHRTLLCAVGRRGQYRLTAWIGLLTALTAMGANAAVYGIARLAGAIPSDVLVAGPRGDQPLTIGLVLFASAVAATLAVAVFALLNIFARRPLRRFQTIALVVFALSLFSPFSVSGAPAGMIATMLAMHVLTAGISVGFITALAERQE